MEENLLFRMNFILQDNAGTTLEANLVKFVEWVLLMKDEPMSIEEIKTQIEDEYKLEFSTEEIRKSIRNKGKHILHDNELFFLEPQYSNTIKLYPSITEELEKYVFKATNELQLEVDEERYLNLIKRYLYYCFNANKETLLALINHKEILFDLKTGFNNEEIKLINCFLQWDNEDKDKCITKIISYCYIFCSLTVKKDNLLSNKLFRGKRFLLDANIIFRLAGINNDSRKLTITSFIRKCKELGIELCYTEETLDEIYRVITTKTKWIISVTGGTEPIDLSEFDSNENDFYKLYRLWCENKNHEYNDYEGFQRHLLSCVLDVLDELKKVSAENYEITERNRFDNYYTSLEEYKKTHTCKIQSKASLRTDINNFMHILRLRKKSNNDLWSVAEFFISADQNLINWSREVMKGVPVIVLPSVWLTIMLRFTGRHTTADDYKAFCSFLELRQHIAPSEIDVYSLVEKMATKTSNNYVKQKIVAEVFANKEEYLLEDTNGYEGIINKAFDKIVDEAKADELNLQSQLEESIKENHRKDELLKKQKRVDDQERIQLLVEKDVEKHFKIPRFIYSIRNVLGFWGLIGIIVIYIGTFKRKWFIYNILLKIFVNEILGVDTIIAILTLLTVALGAFVYFINRFLEWSVSQKLINKYRKKRSEYYDRLFKK